MMFRMKSKGRLQVSWIFNNQFQGTQMSKKSDRRLKCCLIGKKEISFVGRTEFDSPEVDNEILVDAKEQYIRVGDFANVKSHLLRNLIYSVKYRTNQLHIFNCTLLHFKYRSKYHRIYKTRTFKISSSVPSS